MYRNSTILYNIIWVSYVYPGNSESADTEYEWLREQIVPLDNWSLNI